MEGNIEKCHEVPAVDTDTSACPTVHHGDRVDTAPTNTVVHNDNNDDTQKASKHVEITHCSPSDDSITTYDNSASMCTYDSTGFNDTYLTVPSDPHTAEKSYKSVSCRQTKASMRPIKLKQYVYEPMPAAVGRKPQKHTFKRRIKKMSTIAELEDDAMIKDVTHNE